MSSPHRIYFSGSLVCLVAALAIHSTVSAQARTVVFQAQVDGQVRAAEVSVLSHSGVAYVSLTELIHDFKGGCALLGNRAQADLEGKSAWLRTGSTQVQSSLSDFSLRNPTIAAGEEVLIALQDVEDFFERAFALGVAQVQREESGAESRVSRETLLPLPGVQMSPVPATAAQPLADSPAQPAQIEPAAGASAEEVSAPSNSAAQQNAKPAPLGSLKVIVLDPGHGGTDNGAVGVNGLTEKEVTLAIAEQLAHELRESLGARVLLTRENDSDTGQDLRAKFANFNHGEVFLSLHAGAGFSPLANGFELFHNSPPLLTSDGQVENARQAKELARYIDSGLRETTNAPSRGIRRAPCRVLGKVAMPGLIIEVGCLTNPTEAELLASDKYRVKIAKGIAQGLKMACAGAVSTEGQETAAQ